MGVVESFYKEDNPYLVSGSYDKTIKVWNMADNSLVATLTGHLNCIWSLTTFMSNDKVCVASGGYDGTIRIWELESFILIKTLSVSGSNTICSLNTLYDNENN